MKTRDEDSPFDSDEKPLAVSINRAKNCSGFGRTAIYSFLNQGLLRGKKHGRKTLIMFDSLEKLVESLPEYTPGDKNAA